LEVLETVQREGLPTRILVLTARSDQDLALSVIKAGAMGYLLKTVAANALTKAVREVYRGESALDPLIARKVITALQRPAAPPASGIPLTPQELHVLAWVAYGLSNREIAGKLYVSEHTIRTHVGTILEKLQLATRTQAALYAIREKLVRLDQVPAR
jgi:NarL family two-component system response regulator LiaR